MPEVAVLKYRYLHTNRTCLPHLSLSTMKPPGPARRPADPIDPGNHRLSGTPDLTGRWFCRHPGGEQTGGSRAHLDLKHAIRTQAEWRTAPEQAGSVYLPSQKVTREAGGGRSQGLRSWGGAPPCAPVPLRPVLPGLVTPWAGWSSAKMAWAEDFLARVLNAEAATNEGGPLPLPKKGLWCHLFSAGDPSQSEPARLAGLAHPRGGQTAPPGPREPGHGGKYRGGREDWALPPGRQGPPLRCLGSVPKTSSRVPKLH